MSFFVVGCCCLLIYFFNTLIIASDVVNCAKQWEIELQNNKKKQADEGTAFDYHVSYPKPYKFM